MDLDDQIIIVKPEGVLMTSLLIREWGPDQIATAGENKFEALRKGKENTPGIKLPLYKAAFIAISKYSQTLTRSCGVRAGPGMVV